jgi:hypothetical protein
MKAYRASMLGNGPRLPAYPHLRGPMAR